ncbi:MAG: hypothetical protein ACRBB0_00830 [Pelagimonas sp.]|uniref:hypothetical protein n=1 Tax=Pelagimonas sp. TaxID=2073170 RepID=UPI003D6B6902
MSAKFITGVITAAALITAIAAAPVRAGNNNDAFKKVVIGATTIYLLNEIIKEVERGGSGNLQLSHGWNGGHDRYGRHGKGRDHGGYGRHKAKKPPIPSHCIRVAHGKKKGSRYVASRRCLKHNYRAFNRLPQACKTKFRSHGKKRSAYSVRCLRNHGFRTAGRH